MFKNSIDYYIRKVEEMPEKDLVRFIDIELFLTKEEVREIERFLFTPSAFWHGNFGSEATPNISPKTYILSALTTRRIKYWENR